MATKDKKPTKEEIAEAKRQAHVPAPKSETEDDGGSYKIDHLADLDNAETPDTNLHPEEDIPTAANDLSFWGGSWIWNKSAKSYGNKPEDSWFINPSDKLIAEVMNNTPLIFSACEVMLLDKHKDELERERARHLDFLRVAQDAEIVSECLDLLTSYQGRLFESIQQYLGRQASYENQANNDNAKEADVESARDRKVQAAAVCRGWAARLIALVEAYHEVQTDERAYNLSYDFSPAPESPRYGLYKWSITNAMNKIGRRLTRSVKTGTLDAEKYRIPRPWLEESQREIRRHTDEMISDFG